jgi:hypothetical protein
VCCKACEFESRPGHFKSFQLFGSFFVLITFKDHLIEKIAAMKWILTLFGLLNAYYLSAQIEFKIDNFSKDYYGKVNVADTNDVFVKGWVGIFDSKSNKELIHVESEELAFSFHDGKVIANIHELPYGEQSLIIYDDFNFDGKKDFAIENGQNSCYHGPSFVIYLAIKSGFQFDPDFTELAQNYCGLFAMDKEKKQLNTMTKSGCCWHQYSIYNVVNNAPLAIKVIEEDYTKMPYVFNTIRTWNGKKMIETYEYKLNINEIKDQIILTFTLAKNNKKVILFKDMEGALNYALLKPDGQVEFNFPHDSSYAQGIFVFLKNKTGQELRFKNGDARYVIYETNDNQIKIESKIDNKTYVFEGKSDGKKGNLKNLPKLNLTNIESE